MSESVMVLYDSLISDCSSVSQSHRQVQEFQIDMKYVGK